MFDGYVTDPGAMSDGSDASWLKNYQSSFGPSVNKTTNSWVGFPVVLERPTTLSEIEVYAYQTGSTTTSTFTALYVRIYNGNPIEDGTVIWGDADANIMTATAFTGCYRGSDEATTTTNRPIMSVTASGLDIQLEPGTYWVTYALTGTESNGPWTVPHAVPGIGNTGNGVQYSPNSSDWLWLKDSGTYGDYSPAFRIVGSMVPSVVGDTIGVAVFRNGRWLADVHGNSFVDPTGTVADHGFDIYAYGYCTGSSYSLRYHLRSGNPDQYKIDFADIRFTDVDWTNLSVTGAEGTIDIDVPVDLPTGDYTMTVSFRDSRFPWIESSPITASFHVNLPETFTKPIFDNVITIIDTCHCFSNIQWYHRANASDTWQAIPGATGYYYQEAGSLTGEYFVRAKMNGVETYTCPQTDMKRSK